MSWVIIIEKRALNSIEKLKLIQYLLQSERMFNSIKTKHTAKCLSKVFYRERISISKDFWKDSTQYIINNITLAIFLFFMRDIIVMRPTFTLYMI